MSQEYVEIVRRCFDIWNRHDYSAAFEMLDSDVELDMSRNVFNPDIYRGHSGFEQLVSVIDDTWDDFRLMPVEFIDAGDHVVAGTSLQGRGKESGVEVDMRVFQIWTLRDSKVVRVGGGYRDRAEALEAVGLSE